MNKVKAATCGVYDGKDLIVMAMTKNEAQAAEKKINQLIEAAYKEGQESTTIHISHCDLVVIDD